MHLSFYLLFLPGPDFDRTKISWKYAISNTNHSPRLGQRLALLRQIISNVRRPGSIADLEKAFHKQAPVKL